MENECYSMWAAGESRYFLGQCGVEAGSVARRPWLGPLLLVGVGWQRERGAQGELGNISHQRQGQLGGGGRSHSTFSMQTRGESERFRDLHPYTGRDGFEV